MSSGASTPPLLECRDVTVRFAGQRGRPDFVAVNKASLTVGKGEIVGLVGESGSGKSTFARAVIGLQSINSGSISLSGQLLLNRRTVHERGQMQMVFQDPYSSLDPRMSIRDSLFEMLRRHTDLRGRAATQRCSELLDLVQLPQRILSSKPAGMSGGQRQRVAIARALSAEPRLLVADEAVAALDVSVQAGIVNLLDDLRREQGLAVLFISHDLSIVRTLCDRVSVIYLGEVVEERECAELFDDPRHPYTRSLLSAIPRLGSRRDEPAISEPSSRARESSHDY